MSGKGRPTWFPSREVGICSSIAEAACAATSERTSSSPISENGESAGSTCSSSPTPTRTITAGGAEAIVRGAEMPDDPRKINERSLLLEIRYKSFSVWLPGDVERGPSAWGEKPFDKKKETRVVFLPHHGSPRAQPEAWMRAASPAAVVSQNSDCFRKWTLVPCVQSFFLENGAVTMRSDGESMLIEQA